MTRENNRWCRSAALAVVLFAAAPVFGQPLRVRNSSPMARIAAPPVAEPSRLLGSGQTAWSLAGDWSSNATVSVAGDEQILLDGESLALSGRWRRGAGRWQFGAEVTWWFQGGGILDGFIDGYHDLFGFPEGDRPSLRPDRLNYFYARGGQTGLNLDGYSDGPGDVRVSAAWQALLQEDRSVALRVEARIASGDSDDLLGSGGAGIALAIDAARRFDLASWSAQIYAGGGVLYSEDGDVLAKLRENTVLFGNLGVAWPIHPGLTLNLQLDAHGALYDSALAELGNALQISLGGVWHLTPVWDLGIGVLEDISTHSSPDVTFHFELRRRTHE